ncbi:MAG TPA: peptidylprolyl isomerase [Candidatus Hydrogenedentes bacterium]|nr:peptidylprolyl isomerase [Candidatus Hydrogenedentota bacterium]HNT86695.1 peptidylprolyl isomerase [Candidatus Hydrogenedentota bacterium]
MNKIVAILIVIAVLGGVAWFTFVFQPSRLTYAQIQQQAEAEKRLAMAETGGAIDAEAPEKAPDKAAAEKWPAEAPDMFRVKFECTNGTVVIECHKKWAPLGAQRFYELVRKQFFDGAAFFRVVPGFVVQFGMPADPRVGAQWVGSEFPDDPVLETNGPGTVSFASRGENTRTTQVFINLGQNARLDGMGFAPFGKVIEGMDVVKAINAEYGERPDQGRIRTEGASYLKANFPRLDFIERATLVPVEAEPAKAAPAAPEKAPEESPPAEG